MNEKRQSKTSFSDCRPARETNTEFTVFIALGLLCAALTQAGVYLFLSRLTQDYGSAFIIAILSSALVFMLFRALPDTMRLK